MEYNKLLEKARKTYSECVTNAEKRRLESIFPELRGSEDEKIREEILEYISKSTGCKEWIAWLEKQGEKVIPEDINEAALQYVDTCKVDGRVRHSNINLTEPYWTNISMMDAYKAGWIACKCKQTQVTHIVRNIVKDSEKQVRTLLTENAKQDGGKQEPINKIEPKFKVGDWVTNGIDSTFKVMLVKDGMYYRDDDYFVDIETADKAFRLWDIKDAKDGDVLSNGEIIVIFKCFEDPSYGRHLISYIGLDYCGHIQVTDDTWYLGVSKVIPATKEQRELLFLKMKESGYEWNAKNKELKKIENKLTDSYCKDNCKGYQETGKCFADGECKAKRDAMQGLAWSEDDENMMQYTLKCLDVSDYTHQNIEIWFRNIKNKMQPRQRDWSEEDEKRCMWIVRLISTARYSEIENDKIPCDRNELIKWLKVIRDRVHPQWIPTRAQMNALYWMKQYPAGKLKKNEINSLYEQLKTLRHENDEV